MVLPQAMVRVQYWFRVLSLKFCGKSKKICGDISPQSPAFCMYDSRLKIQIQHIINMNMAHHKYRLAYNTPEAERGLPQNTTHGRCHRHSTKLKCAFMVQCHGFYPAQHAKKSTNAFSSNPMLVLCLMTPSGCKASSREDKMMGGTVQWGAWEEKEKEMQWRKKLGRCSGEKNGETFAVTVLSDTWCSALSDRCRLHPPCASVHPSSGSWWGWGGWLCFHRCEFSRWWWGWCSLHNINYMYEWKDRGDRCGLMQC